MKRRSRPTTLPGDSPPRETPNKRARANPPRKLLRTKTPQNYRQEQSLSEEDSDSDPATPPRAVRVKKGTPLFVEPELAKPEPSYTGLPLEDPPPAKIKRELLWRKKKQDAADDADETARDKAKHKYDAQLEVLPPPAASHTRKPLAVSAVATATPLKRRGARAPATPKKPRQTTKRIKVLSPKKQHISNLAGVAHGVKIKQDNDLIKDNDDFCSTCGLPGIFICCELCPKSFHFTCADPPLADVPDDDWHCRECTARAFPDELTNYEHVGLFGPLLSTLEARNPVVFALPRAIRDDTFIGVQTGDFGDYSDDSIKPELTLAALNGAQIRGCNRDELLEVDKLYDIKGNPYLCHKCGELGLHNRILTHCDYCPLVWHLDCLEYPMCSPKTMGSKWRCPAHLEEMLPRNFANARMLRLAKVTDVALYNHFVRMANTLSSMLFQYGDAPFIKQGFLPTLDDYITAENDQRQAEEEASKVEANLPNGAARPAPEFKRPEWLSNTFSQRNMLLAPVSKRSTIGKQILDKGGMIYRVPELLVLLDFITKVKTERTEHPMRHGIRVEERVIETVKDQVIDTLDEYAEALAKEHRIEELAEDADANKAMEALEEFQNRSWSKHALDELVAVAERQAEAEVTAPVVATDEVAELLKIKKLLLLKGKDKVLQFLELA
ncbi:hypothetical protein JNB11_04530 [Kocuria palustris]|nr:hypothetical protein [Kocuria palustris]